MTIQKISDNENGNAHRPGRRRNRLRRLADQKDYKQSKKANRILFIGSIIISLVLTHMLTLYSDATNNIFVDFINSYKHHYNQLICEHGQKLNTNSLLIDLKYERKILHQDEALEELACALKNNTHLNIIAFVGSSGIGKTLTATSLIEHYPWQKNVHAYAWNTHVRYESEKLHVLRMYVNSLADCGPNLLVIDNLTPCDHGIIQALQSLLKEIVGFTEKGELKKRLTVILIFNMNAMETETLYARQYNMLQKLSNTKTINFRSFHDNQLNDCIRREMRLTNLSLTHEQFNEIRKRINVRTSGCKLVRSKLLAQGRPYI